MPGSSCSVIPSSGEETENATAGSSVGVGVEVGRGVGAKVAVGVLVAATSSIGSGEATGGRLPELLPHPAMNFDKATANTKKGGISSFRKIHLFNRL